MPDFLPHHAQRVVFPQNLLCRVVGRLSEPVHDDEALHTAGAPEVVHELRCRYRYPGSGSRPGIRIRTHALIMAVSVHRITWSKLSGCVLVELARQRNQVELTGLGEAFADRAGPDGGPAVAQIYRRKSPVWPGERPTTASPRRDVDLYFISIVPFGRRVTCAVVARVESKPRTHTT